MADAVPANIPLGDNYIVVNPNNGQNSSVNNKRNVAQMNVDSRNNTAGHEIGHLFGLSDL